jgi:hypothetical protein
MRTRLIALSAVAMMSLATALPAAAAPESLNCTVNSTVAKKTLSSTFTVASIDSSLVNQLAPGVTYTLPNGTTIKVVATTPDTTTGNVTSFTGTITSLRTTTTISCKVV